MQAPSPTQFLHCIPQEQNQSPPALFCSCHQSLAPGHTLPIYMHLGTWQKECVFHFSRIHLQQGACDCRLQVTFLLRFLLPPGGPPPLCRRSSAASSRLHGLGLVPQFWLAGIPGGTRALLIFFSEFFHVLISMLT